MPRKYDHETEPDAQGWVTVTTKQQLGDAEPKPLEYRTFGTKAGAPEAWKRWVASITDADTLAEAYDDWVYGVDLSARQKAKAGGPAGTVIDISKTEKADMLTGVVMVKATGAETGRTLSVAERVKGLNFLMGAAAFKGAVPPRAVEESAKGLVEKGLAKMEAGQLVEVKGAPAQTGPARPVRGGK